jgi:hypothetical protein
MQHLGAITEQLRRLDERVTEIEQVTRDTRY